MNEQQKIEPRTLKGFRDYGPREQFARQQMFTKIQKTFESFGFAPLSTPVLEYKEILMGKYGEDEKLVYSFKDNGDRDVAMRYDLTVPLARFVAQNQNELTFPFKRYQIAPVWRADNPQKGRLREFYQCDVDIVGVKSELADAEAFACICKAIEALGITNYELRINNREVFAEFTNLLQTGEDEKKEIIRAIDKVKKIGLDGVTAALREKQISQSTIDQVLAYLSVGEGDRALDELCETVGMSLQPYTEKIKTSKKLLIELGVSEENIVFDPSIARGLDYYTGMVCEITLKDLPSFPSIGGGGRYDNLLDTFSEKSLPAVGCSLGIDRLFDALEEMKLIDAPATVQVLVVNFDEELQDTYVQLASELRAAGINAELYYEAVKLDKQFKYAEAKNIPYAIIIGGEEKASGSVKIKNLQTREQEEVNMASVVSYFTSKQ
jgi:histidyl-tRNA synthetase